MDGVLIAQLIHIIAEIGVADELAGGPESVDVLADRLQVSPDGLHRALRALATVGLFTETAPRTFTLTELGDALRSEAPDSVRDIARMRGGREHWETWTELRYSIRTGRATFPHVHGATLWSFLDDHPAVQARFDSAMGDNTKQMHAVIERYHDFSGARRVVDVGGGQGHLAARLLRAHPRLTAVVFDQEQTARSADLVLTKAGVRDRAEIVCGDFFESVPGGGDVYVLSRILHDWDDEHARAILDRVRDALPAGGRVVVADSVVPEGDRPHPAKMTDIMMLALNGGRERTEAELAALFEAAGLRHTATVHPPAPISLMLAAAGPPAGR